MYCVCPDNCVTRPSVADIERNSLASALYSLAISTISAHTKECSLECTNTSDTWKSCQWKVVCDTHLEFFSYGVAACALIGLNIHPYLPLDLQVAPFTNMV